MPLRMSINARCLPIPPVRHAFQLYIQTVPCYPEDSKFEGHRCLAMMAVLSRGRGTC